MSSLTSAAAPAPAERPTMRLSQLGDELLARYASRGSERAFTALYERYHQQLYRYCRSILRHDSDAQDALQSTFAGALQALRRNQRNAPLRPWLYRIAHNESISLLRRRSRDSADELDSESLGVGSSVEQQAADRARWRTLMQDIGLLPDRQRGALLLRELSGLSHEEIAITLRTTTAGAKQAIFEARQALAELEEGRAMKCEEVRRQISEGDRRVLRGRRVGAHLRECSACGAFALAIPSRRTQLRAMTPALPPAAAAALLTRSLHAASFQGGAGGTSAAATAGLAGKTAGTALAWKALAGVAIVATTAAGVTGVSHLVAHHHASATAPSAPAHHARSVLNVRTGAQSTGRPSATTHAAGTQGSALARHSQSAASHAKARSHGRSTTAASHRNAHSYRTRRVNGSSPGHSSTSSRGGSSHTAPAAQVSGAPVHHAGPVSQTSHHVAARASSVKPTAPVHRATARTHKAHH